jgi:anti-anti-sigma factor
MARAASTDKKVRVRELTVAAEEGQLSRVRDFVVEACQEANFSDREASNTKLAVDEACTNIIKHAYDGPERGEITVRIEILPGDLQIALLDNGKRFDFAAVQDPDLDEYVETGRKGGLGIFLINRLMDGVKYHSDDTGNELVLSKRSQTAVARGLIAPEDRPFRGTLRYKFTLRAAGGLLLLVAAIWAFVFVRQTADIGSQRATQWMEKRRLAGNLSNRSKDVLLRPEAFSVEQTNLSSYLARLVAGDGEIAWVRVVDANGQIVSSGTIEEIFTPYREPADATQIGGDSAMVWTSLRLDNRDVRDIGHFVRVTNPDTGELLNLGIVHLGVFEDAVEANIKDPRLTVTLIMIAIFLVGILLIVGLVSVFVKPIQVLTDGVRAIGDGTLDTRLEIDGPAEIGAIASVFNEITNKFRKAQESVLEQEKMQKEMEVAKEIQHSLLPRRRPEVSGYDIAPLYQAAAEVGGDYYDFVNVDEDTIGVVVADVSGKGVPGSLVMTMIRTALRMEARGNKNASDVMSKMNAFVTDDMKKGMFVTMFYVILDSKNRIISYASAGHNPMILYRHETNETFFLNPKGFPVGISLPDENLFRKSISLEKIKLKKDDMLLIYTDGVTEAMNEKRDQYGEARLIETIKKNGHLHPEDFIAALERDIKKFTGGFPQNDDITVVAVKEKLTADDVLYGIRKKLIDLVDVEGLSVKDACRQMKMSPATYYRYKKRLEVMGERGLKNKVLRQDTVLKRVSLEARKEIIDIIVGNPEYGAKRIAAIYNEDKEEARQITEHMVYDELKRLNLNTKDLRLEYLRRNRLLEDEMLEDADHRPGKEIIEDLLKEMAGTEPVESAAGEEAETPDGGGADEIGEELDEALARTDPGTEFEQIDDIGMSVSTSPAGITTILVNGHLDSVTSSSLEQRMKRLVSDGNSRFVVDLSDVTYISSGGWGVFTGEVRGLREHGGDIVLVGMSPEVYDVYELLGFDDVLKAFTNPQEATEYFDLPPEERLAVVSSPVAGDLLDRPRLDDGKSDLLPGETYVPEWESLKIEATTVGPLADTAVVSLRGIIDTVSAENLRAALSRIVAEQIFKIVVDMSQVEYVSSGGWGTFTERLREVRRNGGDIKLFGMDPDVYYVFTMLGFNIVLSSFDILTEAIEDFGRGPHDPGRSDGPLMPDPEEIERSIDVLTEITEPEKTEEAVPDVNLSDRDIRAVAHWEAAGNGVKIAHLSGYIEAAAGAALEAGLARELESRPRVVLFDLAKVDYISSTGWGQFARCAESMREWNGVVALYGMGQDLHDIYSCLEFQSIIREYPGLEQAIRGATADADAAGPPEAVAPAEAPDVDVEAERDAPADLGPGGDLPDFPGGEAGEAVETVDETDFESLNDLLREADDVDADEAAPPGEATETVAEEPGRWPGEPGEPGQPAEPGDPDEPETTTVETAGREDGVYEEDRPLAGRSTPLAEEPDREPVDGDPTFVDMTEQTDTVDVEAAVSDKHYDQDERLREFGWARYGDKLKKRNQKRQNRKKKKKDD